MVYFVCIYSSVMINTTNAVKQLGCTTSNSIVDVLYAQDRAVFSFSVNGKRDKAWYQRLIIPHLCFCRVLASVALQIQCKKPYGLDGA